MAVLPFDSEKTRTRLQMKGEEIKITRVLVQEGHVSGVTEEEIVSGIYILRDAAECEFLTTKITLQLEWKRGRKRRRNREYYLQKKDEKLKAKARSRRRREKKEARGNEANKRKRVSAINDNSSEEIDGNEENSVVQERKLFGRLHPEGLIRRDEPRDPISLSMIQWQRWSEGETQSDTNVLPIRSKILPPLLVEAGLEYQPRTKNITERSSFFEGDRLRNLSDKMYASSSMKVINALGGKARNWAFHEFFYSDIDRAW